MVMPAFPPLHHNGGDAPFVLGKGRATEKSWLCAILPSYLGTSCADFASQEKHITVPAPQKSAFEEEAACLSICMAMGRLYPQGAVCVIEYGNEIKGIPYLRHVICVFRLQLLIHPAWRAPENQSQSLLHPCPRLAPHGSARARQ